MKKIFNFIFLQETVAWASRMETTFVVVIRATSRTAQPYRIIHRDTSCDSKCENNNKHMRKNDSCRLDGNARLSCHTLSSHVITTKPRCCYAQGEKGGLYLLRYNEEEKEGVCCPI